MSDFERKVKNYLLKAENSSDDEPDTSELTMILVDFANEIDSPSMAKWLEDYGTDSPPDFYPETFDDI